MRRQLLTGLLMTVVLTVLLGLAYPLAVTGVSQVALAARADGSLVRSQGRVVGSSLLGQGFKVTVERGRFVDSPLAPNVLATVHPSSILRGRPEDRKRNMAAFVADLQVAATKLSPG